MKKRQIAATLLLSLTPLLCPMFLPLGLDLSHPAEAAWYDNENTFLDRGKQAYNQGQFDQAIQALTESIKLNGDRADSYYWRGLALLAIKQNDRALADLTDAIRLAPDSTSCFLSRGLLYSNLGQLDKAVADFDRALAIDPNLIDAKTNRDFAAKELEKQKIAKAKPVEPASTELAVTTVSNNQVVASSQTGSSVRPHVARTTSGYDSKGKPTYGVSTTATVTPAVTGRMVVATADGINDPKWLALQKELEAKVAREKKEAELAAVERSRNELKARELALKEKEAEERIERQRNKHEVEDARRLAMANNAKVKTPAKVTAKTETESQPEESALDVTNRPVRDKWALIVGISNFQDNKLNLKYPAKDAKDFNDYLLKEGNFAPDHVKLLVNEQATRANILSELGDKWLPRVANPDDLVVIYISSHGSASDMDIGGVNYLLAYDSQVDSLYASGLPMQDLTRIIKGRVHSDRVVLVLDACHSGAADPGSKGLFRQGNVDITEVAQGTGQLVISSSQPSQVSWESKHYQNSVFTRCLIESLKSKGSATTLGEAFSNMKDKVQQEVLTERGVLQTPVLKSRWKGNDLRLAAPAVTPRPGLAENP
ncbi:caspase family protein [bacterium]|nr:caspase family protein [bacterium]MBP9810988.1 caspase family protein [bacterium]